MKTSNFKRIIFIIFFIVLEILTILRYEDASKEMIYFVWTFIYLVLILSKFFGGNSVLPTQGISNSDGSRYLFMGIHLNNILNKDSTKSSEPISNYFFDLPLLLLFVINLVLSIINS